MYLKNVLRSGQYVALVPEGIPIVLQYGPSGILECAYLGYDGKHKLDDSAYHEIYHHNSIQRKVPIKNGTTWVKGVLYTSRTLCIDLEFSTDLEQYKEFVNDFKVNSANYNFFAITVNSTALTLKGSIAIRQWLEMSKLHTVPGFLVNSNMTEELFKNILRSIWNFKYPLVMAYCIFDGADEPAIMYTGLSQRVIQNIEYDVDENGYISVELSTKLSVLHSSVADALSFGVGQYDVVSLDNSYNIIHVSKTSKSARSLPSIYTCPVCGKQTQFTTQSTICQCSNTTCPTTMYNKVVHLLYALGVPVLSRDEFDECVNDLSFSILGDIFSSTMYEDAEFNITLYQLLDGLIPVESVRNRHVIEQFVNNCSNNILTLRHYIKNPYDISKDFNIEDDVNLKQLCKCFTPEFMNDLDAVLNSENVHIVSTDRKYKGDPIFRGKTLYLTGQFAHGSIEEVTSILNSYACTITNHFDTSVDGVLVGDIKENVNGVAIKKAKKHHIPIMDESWFFTKYEIDEDIETKL